MIRAVLRACACLGLLALPFAAQAQSDKAQALAAIEVFGTAFKQGRLVDALAMSPVCVLDQMAAKEGLDRDGLIAKRREETVMIRTLAKSGGYVFDADVQGAEVIRVSDTLKVLPFSVKAQLGALMPAREFRMVAYADGDQWRVAAAANDAEREMLRNCYPDLRPRHLN